MLSSPMDQRFNFQNYVVRKKVFKLFGEDFHVYNPNDEVVFYAKLKPFAWKEEIRIYGDESKQVQYLEIRARKMLDFSATYDVFDSLTGEKVGALRRKGFRSLFKDEWLILNNQDQEIGLIQEDNPILALIRRFLTNLIPQEFEGFVNQNKVLHFAQEFNPFVAKVKLDFSLNTANLLDKRLGIAAGILLTAIEGRQE